MTDLDRAALSAFSACITQAFALARHDPQIHDPAKLASVMAYEYASAFLEEKDRRDEMEKILKAPT